MSNGSWLTQSREFDVAKVLTYLRDAGRPDRQDVGDDDQGRQPDASDSDEMEEVQEWSRLKILRYEVNRWASAWGGLLYWGDSLDEGFHDACARGRNDRAEALQALRWGTIISGWGQAATLVF